jgi:CarD family transcriptional regulator
MKTTKNSKKIQEKKASKKPLKKTVSKVKKPNKIVISKKPIEKKPAKIVKKLLKESTKKINKKNVLKVKLVKKNPSKINKKNILKTKLIKEKILKKQIVAKKDNIQKVTKKIEEKNKKISVPSKKKSSETKQNNYSINSYVVYPSHGVGQIINIENTIVMQQHISCYLIYFDRERLTIKIPTNKVEKFGIRPLVSKEQMSEVFSILRSGVKKMKGMWSRRAQEYETKINSGDIIMLAEVLRDLTRDIEDSERSYSERIIYETAIFRLACEYSAIYGIPFETARDKITITAKDKLESDSKFSKKDDDFDDFDKIKKTTDPEEEEEEDEEEEEEDDFNYEYNEDDDFDDDDEKPRKKKK